MFRNLQNRAAQHLFTHAFERESDLHLYLMSCTGALFSLVVHMYYLAIFLVYDIQRLAMLNVLSIALYLFVFRYIHRRDYVTVGLLISLDVVLYTTLMSSLYGIDTYIISHYLIVIVMQGAVPYGKLRMRMLVILSVLVCATFAVYRGVYVSPLYTFAPALRRFITIVNIYLLFIATIIQLFIGNVVQLIVLRLHKVRMADLSNQVNTDALTGLYNRWYAAKCFKERAMTQADQDCCVAMLDVDNFKRINDTYGHAAGDEVLRVLADYLKSRLRNTDVIFRWGGEEFLVILEHIGIEAAFRVMDSIRSEIAALSIALPDESVLSVTVTIGVGTLDIQNSQVSIDRCDQGLYIGKRSTKNVTIRV